MESGEYFGVGSIVSCKTCYNQSYEGEVLAFDPQCKMLVLKCAASNDRGSFNDVHMININLVGEIQVKKENSTGAPASLNNLSTQRLNVRTKLEVEKKKRFLTAMASGVTVEGQKLFLAITKTIDEVCWRGCDIVVLDQVTISPPYKQENVTGDESSKAFNHVKKIVEKYLKEMNVNSN